MSRFKILATPLLLTAILVSAVPASAQRELPLNNKPILRDFGMSPAYYGSVDMGDYDGDGDVDLLVSGRSGSHIATKVYCRAEIAFLWIAPPDTPMTDTMATFHEVTTSLPSLWQSSAKWGDYDGDGDLDVIASGLNGIGDTPSIGAVTRLFEYRNGFFVEDLRTVFPGVYAGENAWGDYDGDGDQDLVITGATSVQAPFAPLTRVYRNDGGFLVEIDSGLPDVAFGAVAWADVDGDGDLELALQGVQEGGRFITDVFINSGNDRFEAMEAGLPALAYGSFDWADVDADGDLDLLLTGGAFDPNVLRGVTAIYLNDGDRFRPSDAQLAGVVLGSATFLDFDVDGLLDVVLTGSIDAMSQPVFILYLNSGTSFDPALRADGLKFSDIAAGDFNGDGDPDVVAIGQTSEGFTFLNFFQNQILVDIDVSDFNQGQIVETLGCYSGRSNPDPN